MKTAALRIPIMPHTSPAASQPPGMKLPLRDHQLRALNRCLVIESSQSGLNRDFGHRYDFTSRGGCLADSVGTGKTATTIGLVLSSSSGGEGDTLVVAPKHLIPQWKNEIAKFSDEIDVIEGQAEYERRSSQIPTSTTTTTNRKKRRIVLVDVDTILGEHRLWYDFRRVYEKQGGREIKVDPDTRQKYRTAAQFSVRSPKGPCTYIGWVYIGSLHMPQQPGWRRVVFDEIQDLVQAGTESQKCLLQLSRTAKNVWLLSATPFPHGNASVAANHELLGFCRMKMDVEVSYQLPPSHPLERIKRQLYICSPPHVADTAVNVTVSRRTEFVERLDIEEGFYNLSRNKILEEYGSGSSDCNWFSAPFYSLREMTVHPEASAELRTVLMSSSNSNSSFGPKKRKYTKNVSTSVDAAATRAVREARQRLWEFEQRNPQANQQRLHDIQRSIALAEKVKTFRQTTPLLNNVFEGQIDAYKMDQRRIKFQMLIHDHYCVCPKYTSDDCKADSRVQFRIIREEDNRNVSPEFLTMVRDVINYFVHTLAENKEKEVGNGGKVQMLDHYISVTKRTKQLRQAALQAQIKEMEELKVRIETLSNVNTIGNNKENKTLVVDKLASKYGSKPAALVRYLQDIVQKQQQQVIIFSYWHDTLKLIQGTLKKCGLSSVFCDGPHTARALEEFTNGHVPIVLLSAQSKASGANLQCATHVILLDPSGSTAEHGCTLEEQAIGRAARMGQDRPVTVTRFCVVGTLEEDLFQQIDEAREAKRKKANDCTYVIQDSSKVKEVETRVVVQPTNDEDDAVEVTAALTHEERIQKDFQRAEEKGEIITMLDDTDDEEEDQQTKSGPISVVTPVNKGAVRVKKELNARKRKQTTVLV